VTCEMCEEQKAKHVISNKYNNKKLIVCDECKLWFKQSPSEEVKQNEH
jgi:ribosome-binding protein aMBF1 (putative translation factor)